MAVCYCSETTILYILHRFRDTAICLLCLTANELEQSFNTLMAVNRIAYVWVISYSSVIAFWLTHAMFSEILGHFTFRISLSLSGIAMYEYTHRPQRVNYRGYLHVAERKKSKKWKLSMIPLYGHSANLANLNEPLPSANCSWKGLQYVKWPSRSTKLSVVTIP